MSKKKEIAVTQEAGLITIPTAAPIEPAESTESASTALEPVGNTSMEKSEFYTMLDTVQPFGFNAMYFQELNDTLAMATPKDLLELTVPGGGGTQFEIPDPDAPNGAAYMPELTGVVLGTQIGRALWLKDDEPNPTGIKVPICKSSDAKVGHFDKEVLVQLGKPLPSGICATCPYAVFDGDCRPYQRLFLLVQGYALPIIFRMSKMSMLKWRVFTKAKLAKLGGAKQIFGSKVTFTLKKETSKEVNKPYAVAIPGAAKEPITPEEREFAGYYREMVEHLIADPHALPVPARDEE